MIQHLTIVVCAILLTAPLGCSSDQTAVPAPVHGLAGTWSLVSRQDRTAAREIVPEPGLGSDPIVLLIYDMGGNMAAQLMRRGDRLAGTEPQATSAPSNNSGAVGGYDAYFGTYAVDSANGTVTHTLHGALVPADVGKSLTRRFRLHGDTLEIWFETTSADGRPVIRTLLWHRAS